MRKLTPSSLVTQSLYFNIFIVGYVRHHTKRTNDELRNNSPFEDVVYLVWDIEDICMDGETFCSEVYSV